MEASAAEAVEGGPRNSGIGGNVDRLSVVEASIDDAVEVDVLVLAMQLASGEVLHHVRSAIAVGVGVEPREQAELVDLAGIGHRVSGGIVQPKYHIKAFS